MTLTFKMRPSAQPLLWKWVSFAWEWKITSISKAEPLNLVLIQRLGGTRKWPITLQLPLPFLQVGPVLPFYLHLVDDKEAVNLAVVKFSVETMMRWLFWEIRKKGKAGPILNVYFTEVLQKVDWLECCPNMIRPALQFWLLFIIICSLKCTITNLDQNMWHLQLDFRHNCFLPIHHGHTQQERSRFRCIALHLATRYCLLDWQWWDLHCMQRLLHNPGTDKQLRHLTYPILHHTLTSRPQRRKLQLGPLLHLVLPLNELKMNFNIFFLYLHLC